MAIKKSKFIHPNACPKCGEIFKRIAGIWRCEKCKINKSYNINDGRPREGWATNSLHIKSLIEEEN